MKNPWASSTAAATPQQQNIRRLAQWHLQQASEHQQAAAHSRDRSEQQQHLQQADWHQNTASAWQALLPAVNPAQRFSARG